MNKEITCDNCKLWTKREDQRPAWDVLNKAGDVLRSNGEMPGFLSKTLVRAGMSGLGDRKCSVMGSIFGSAPCVSPKEFTPKIPNY